MHTYLTHSHKKAENEDRWETSDGCEDRKQQRQNSRPRHTEQEEKLAADLLGQSSSEDLCRRVAVEERSKNETLVLHIPVERTRL